MIWKLTIDANYGIEALLTNNCKCSIRTAQDAISSETFIAKHHPCARTSSDDLLLQVLCKKKSEILQWKLLPLPGDATANTGEKTKLSENFTRISPINQQTTNKVEPIPASKGQSEGLGEGRKVSFPGASNPIMSRERICTFSRSFLSS